MINASQLQVIRESLDKLKVDFDNSLDFLNSKTKYELVEIFKEREAKWRELLAITYEELFTQINTSKEVLLEQIKGSIYIDASVLEEENKPEMVLKVTWKRLENSIEPFMFEPVGNSQGWVNYRYSKYFDPKYKPFFTNESKGMGAFREAIKRGYQVVKSEEK